MSAKGSISLGARGVASGTRWETGGSFLDHDVDGRLDLAVF
jgi:hypothetical protein